MARILLVEDEKALASALKRGLEDEKHIVDVEHDGEDGLRAAELATYDVLILDIMLPGITGLEICRRLRKQRSLVPVLMLTARDTTADVVAGLDAGGDDYLTKPFAFEELLARVRSLLRRGTGNKSSTLSAGPISIDEVAHRVRCFEHDVELTLKEFQLLEVLVRRKNAVLSKDQLVEAAWPREVAPESNAVEVHIGSLRRKLERAGALIHTVRGVGYVLREGDH